MKRSRTSQVAVVYTVLQVATVALVLWLSKHFQVARLSVTLVALAPTVPGAFLALAAYLADRRDAAADTGGKLKALAAAVDAAETLQRAQLIGPGAHRIDVAFHHHTEPANNAVGAAPDGRLTDIVAYYQRLRPARLVITGEPGAGKTLLALDLLLGLLVPVPADTEPVPVRFSLASWDTGRPLQKWLAHQVHQQFRDQGITLADAAALVDQHRILPVLDGLDEMDTDATPVGRRRAARALQELNKFQDRKGSAPVILTCRTTQYQELAALDLRMREAARIQLDPVTPDQATAYLTARSTNPDRWTPVIDALTTAPGGTLARSLATPWRLNLAVTAYEDRHPDDQTYFRNPDHLLTLASPSAVRDHLLALYLPAAAHQHPTRPNRYSPDQTHRWLAALAAHLGTITPASTASSTDFVLHQLWPMAGARRVRTAETLLVAFLALVVSTLLLSTLPLSQVPITFSARQRLGASAFVLFGLAAIRQASRPLVPEPQTFQLQRLRSPIGRHQLARTFAIALAFVLACGLVGGVAGGLIGGRHGVIPLGLAAALGAGLAAGSAFGSAVGFENRLEDAPPTDPRHLVRDDFALGFTVGFVGGLALGLMLAFGLGGGPPFAFKFTVGLAAGLALGLYGFTGAGRRYLVFLFCIRGRLPWRLGTFLNWAYEAGLLRISGVAYQFRHRELQDWLTAHSVP
ncbi:NACHT domain-containing protein [Streptomyces sp. NPDC026665]|uniref:NACHT domain-containing protein n=1 Tax=Streptomyces sp. NPDC026665 TaxID=3154798 RepID=UPI0033C57A66